MMDDYYIDGAQRKKLVSKWIPISLGFLHVWASLLVISAAFLGRTNITIDGMFATCGWGIFGLLFLLISNKAVDFVMSKFGSVPQQTIETTKTETTTVTPVETKVNDVNIKAENVNVGN